MNERQRKLIIGSLLHDIGKVVYRSGDGRNHSSSGYDYLKNEIGFNDKEILDCVRYHHGNYLARAQIADDSLAYITYIADNIAAAADRRESDDKEDGFDKQVPLDSIFNILNGSHGNMHFEKMVLDVKNGINYPTSDTTKMDESFYKTVVLNLTNNLKNFEFTDEYVSSLLSVMEANFTYIPSSTSKREIADISLYDHVKMTAAIGSCIEEYLCEKKVTNYKEALFENAKDFYDEKAFLLYSMDVSGIQNFIYTISSKGALKGLRARSFYLEIMMEHVIDELLNCIELSRANLIYLGGGHCYLLAPNTSKTKERIEKQEESINKWLEKTFDIALYIAGGWSECSANNLKNVPVGSYEEIYRNVSSIISAKKMHRYSAQDIRTLNDKKQDGERECSICRNMSELDSDNRCPICASLDKMSTNIVHHGFFAVVNKPAPVSLPLPGDMYLIADTRDKVLELMETPEYVRCYTKNNIFIGKHVATKLWVGDYTSGDTFDEFAKKAEGIERLGILRADVDNLGTAFVSGFKREDDRYVTLSRTATLSRQLSLFFKCYINELMRIGEDSRLGKSGERQLCIVYAGGDDVFLAGSWNDIVEAAIDLHKALKKFTQDALTISAGIGIYSSGLPINIMAKETAELEETSKNVDGKNAITLFDKSMAFRWPEFIEKVLDEKLATIKEFFEYSDERGKAFLYNILDLIRNTEDKINTARYVYLLSRMEPGQDEAKEIKIAYKKYSSKMYEWMLDENDRQEVIAALYIYVYLKREREE